MNPFDYFSPATLAEASEILARYNGEARVVAGGTDLLLKMKAGKLAPRAVVNIKRIPDLQARAFNSHLTLGALTTLEDLRGSPIVRKHFPAVAAACGAMASVQIRNLATLGGNLCNAAPSADLAPVFIALNATALISGLRGQRRVTLDDFFCGPGKTVLAADELLVAVEIPAAAGPATYLKLSPREHMDIAVVGVGLALRFVETSRREAGAAPVCAEARVVLGAVAPAPLRARLAEAELTGGPLTADRIGRAAQFAAEEARPIDDVRGSAWYRRRMVQVMTRRGLVELAAQTRH